MKFVLAPDKYKGSLTGMEFCDAVEEGIRKVMPNAEVLKLPMADGGDGTIEIIQYYLEGNFTKVEVLDPLFRSITSNYLLSKDKKTAFIEMSEASGHKLLKTSELNCMLTTSLGTGEFILNALYKGVEHIILGIGGSATNDGGMGMATALGYEFLDEKNNVLEPIGENLVKVRHIKKNNIHPKLLNTNFSIACDVTNPFYGPNGAAHIYAAQKGASEEEAVFLDKGLENFARVITNNFGIDVQKIPGAGAAGGLGGGAVVFLNGKLSPGIDLVKKISNFEKLIADADWIITGEGCLDDQTLSGKTIDGVLESAKKFNIKVAALCGSVVISSEQQERIGLHYCASILNAITDLSAAMQNSRKNLVFSAYNFAKILQEK